MIDEVVKFLQESIPSATIDSSLSHMENVKFFLDSFKEYSSGLKEKLEKEIDKKVNDKRLIDITKWWTTIHTKFQDDLKDGKDCLA